MSRAVTVMLALCAAGWVAEAQLLAVEVELTARGAVQDQIAVLPVDLQALRAALGIDLTGGGWAAQVVSAETGAPVVAQTSLETDDDGVATRARVLWRVPGSAALGETRRFTVTLGAPPQASVEVAGVSVERTADEIVVRTPWFTAHHDLHAGGMLGAVEFAGDGTLPLRMNDRLWSEDRGGWNLTNDRAPAVEVVAEGPLVVIVRATAHYCNAAGEPAPGEPRATYEFAYSALQPTVGMRATISQRDGPDWQQVHVFEMYHKTEQPFFDTVAWSPPLQSIPFVDEAKTHSLGSSAWGALLTDEVALALLGPDLYGIHTNLTGHGVYVHGPWHTFRDGAYSFEATLYLGPSGGSAEALAERLDALAAGWEVSARLPQLERPIAQVRETIAAAAPRIAERLQGEQAERARWLLEVARCLQADAERAATSLDALRDWESAVVAAAATVSTAVSQWDVLQPPAITPVVSLTEDTCVLAKGRTVLRLERAGNTVRVAQVGRAGEEPALMLAPGAGTMGNLWTVGFRRGTVGEIATIAPGDADAVEWAATGAGDEAGVAITWRGCDLAGRADAVDVTVTVRPDPGSDLLLWSIAWENRAEEFGIWEIDFPRIGGVGPGGQVCVPNKWGTVHQAPMAGSGYRATYPSQGAFAQMMCWWGERAGLYYAAHDPEAGVKELSALNDGDATVALDVVTSPAGMGVPAAQGSLGYEVAVGSFNGDWFDAGKLYRRWALQQFWTRKGPLAEREDVPRWWKDCALSIRPTGAPEFVADFGAQLQAAFEMEAVLHWYNWHNNPFDNDYPEYFPAKPGFGETVAALQAAGVHVMPYVNGHLWDTDTASWEAENARSGAALTPDGDLYIEGWQQQKHAVMCPHSELWTEKLRQIAVRLADEYGCDGIYLDQIGAASPRLCFATDHGHPVGGGGFWARGYDHLLEVMRAACHAINPRFIMTTESQAEPYMAGLDGYLMCNLVGANQVPLYSAIYGGYTQTFGRLGEVDNPVAFRMEHGQAFAFGSIMGRINSLALLKPENAELLAYLKSLAEIRRDYRDFLALGEMLRPPDLGLDIPTVTTQWLSKTSDIVTMSAIQASAWRAPDGRLGLFYTNVSEEDVSFRHALDRFAYGVPRQEGTAPLQTTMRTFNAGGDREPTLDTGEGGYLISHTLAPMETLVVVIERP